MATLLVLGSKPDPVLPPPGSYDDVACANASGFSAARHGLPDPAFTVMSAILTSGKKEANDLALRALEGLRTGTLYLYPRPVAGHAVRRAVRIVKSFRTHPWYFRRRLASLQYHYAKFESHRFEYYESLVKDLCDHDPAVEACLQHKALSTGMLALALAIAQGRYAGYIVSGFSFEITHAYALNPLIAARGTTRSKHAETDVTVLAYLSRKHGNIFTTEPLVRERAEVPLFAPPTEPSAVAGAVG